MRRHRRRRRAQPCRLAPDAALEAVTGGALLPSSCPVGHVVVQPPRRADAAIPEQHSWLGEHGVLIHVTLHDLPAVPELGMESELRIPIYQDARAALQVGLDLLRRALPPVVLRMDDESRYAC